MKHKERDTHTVHSHAHTRTRTHARTHSLTHSHTHTHIHTHTHTRTHALTHTPHTHTTHTHTTHTHHTHTHARTHARTHTPHTHPHTHHTHTHTHTHTTHARTHARTHTHTHKGLMRWRGQSQACLHLKAGSQLQNRITSQLSLICYRPLGYKEDFTKGKHSKTFLKFISVERQQTGLMFQDRNSCFIFPGCWFCAADVNDALFILLKPIKHFLMNCICMCSFTKTNLPAHSRTSERNQILLECFVLLAKFSESYSNHPKLLIQPMSWNEEMIICI